MKIGIVGAGAVGRWLAWVHQKAGQDVTLICHNPNQAIALTQQGLTVEYGEQLDQVRLHAVTWESGPTSDLLSEPFDLWIVTVKAHQWANFYEDWFAYRNRMSQTLDEKTNWIAVHNGIVDYQTIAPELQPHILRSICTYGLTALDDSRVQVRGEGDWLIEQPKDPKDQLTLNLWCELMRTGIQTKIVTDIENHILRKLLVNACLNPVTALTRLVNGKAWDNPHSRDLLFQLVSEAQRIGKLTFGYELADALAYVEQVCKMTYWNRSSMLQDLEAGKTTEIEAINGWLLRNAERLNVQIPYNQTVYNLIKAQEAIVSHEQTNKGNEQEQ